MQLISCVQYGTQDDTDRYYCEEKCWDLCEQRFFVPNRGSSLQSDTLDNIDVNVKLYVDSFDYPVFTETFKYTFSSFLGVLGGILGLWLGLNFLDTVECMKTAAIIFLRVIKRNSVTHSENQTVSRGAVINASTAQLRHQNISRHQRYENTVHHLRLEEIWHVIF